MIRMDLETRLTSLGEHLHLDDGERAGMSERVMARISDAEIDRERRRGRLLRYAAAALLVTAFIALAVPASRNTVAGWFGLDGVRIERRQDVGTPGEPPLATPDEIGPAELPGPGDSREVTVNGRVVLVSVIEGELTGEVLVKTLSQETEIVETSVGSAPALWISGAPHDLAYVSPAGSIAIERVAGNTLVWQDDLMIGRLEGFDSVDAAIEYAIELGTND